MTQEEVHDFLCFRYGMDASDSVRRTERCTALPNKDNQESILSIYAVFSKQ
jgi:hypothetical protein